MPTNSIQKARKHVFKPTLIAIIALSVATPAVGGGSTWAPIFQMLSQGDQFFFWTSATHVSPPACATDPRWVINTSTTGGQSIMATVLSAQAQGKAVTVYGTGTCSVWPDSETVQYVTVAS